MSKSKKTSGGKSKRTINHIAQIKKRDGRIVKFNKNKVIDVIYKAGASTEEYNFRVARSLANDVVNVLNSKFADKDMIPGVEDI